MREVIKRFGARVAAGVGAILLSVSVLVGGAVAAGATETQAAKPCAPLNGIPCQATTRDVSVPRALPNTRPAGVEMTVTPTADARAARYRFFSTVTVLTRNISGWDIAFRLFSKTRAWVWPNAWVWYRAPADGWTYYSRITCRTGERICLGGFAPSRPGLSWGVGPNNNRPCWNCCFTCRSGTVRYTLTR